MKADKKLKKSYICPTKTYCTPIKNVFINNNQNKIHHIHFVGIGGVSVSSLAIFALKNGFVVTGSDSHESDIVKSLKQMGIKVFLHHSKENILGANLVVYSSACEHCIEVEFAKNQGIAVMSRAQFLAQVLNLYKTTICVAGAHGKTTTTALIFEILKTAGKLPSLHLGGNLVDSHLSYNYNSGDTMVCEACEYKDSFLQFYPSIGVVLNIACEHLDYFKSLKNVKKSFTAFAKQSKSLVCFADCKIEHKNKITFDFSNANFTASNIKMSKSGKYSFDCYYNGELYLQIKLNLIGKHNILNALASIAVCHILGIEKKHIKMGLANFCGVERRFQFLNKKKFIVHDYAHHPDEIASSISETRQFYKKNLLIVFQPHTYSRTKTLLSQFVNVFKRQKEVLVLPTYSAREKYDAQGSAFTLSKKIGCNAIYIRGKAVATNYILNKIKDGYGVLFLGAGDIFDLAKNIAKMC